MSSWLVRASASPRALNYDFIFVDLIGGPCPSTCLCSSAEDRAEQGVGVQAGAGHRRRLAHHPWR
jgi:hypothetical protein